MVVEVVTSTSCSRSSSSSSSCCCSSSSCQQLEADALPLEIASVLGRCMQASRDLPDLLIGFCQGTEKQQRGDALSVLPERHLQCAHMVLLWGWGTASRLSRPVAFACPEP